LLSNERETTELCTSPEQLMIPNKFTPQQPKTCQTSFVETQSTNAMAI